LIFCLLFYQEKSEGSLGANPKEEQFLFQRDFKMKATYCCQNLNALQKKIINVRVFRNHNIH
jgi:hypothetical protein